MDGLNSHLTDKRLREMQLAFKDRCYYHLLKVPKGKVVTYKCLAEVMNTRAYQAIGQAMATNPNLIAVPCHRVVHTDGQIGNYVLGQQVKRQLLESEGIEVIMGKIASLESVLFTFD